MAVLSFDIFARDHASKAFRDVGNEAEKAGRKVEEANAKSALFRGGAADVDRELSRLGGTLRGLGGQFTGLAGDVGKAGASLIAGAASMSLLGASAASGALSVAEFAAALAPAAGAIAALPGAVVAGAAALGVFKLAVYGVSDALKAAYEGDLEKFDKALAKLTPAAADFAREFQATVPALKEFQQAAQSGFFGELNGHLGEFVAGLRDLQPYIAGVAAEMGRWASTVAEFATSSRTVGQLATVLDLVRQGFGDVRGAVQPLLAGFLDLSVVGAQFLRGMGPGVADLATRFGQFLSQAAASGRALDWMTNALGVFRQLGAIAEDVGGILASIFRALETSGAGALGVVGQLLNSLNGFLASSQGQSTLVEIFTALHRVGAALGPILAAVAHALATIAPQVANIAVAFAPLIAEIVTALGPALAALGPGITAVGNALSQAFARPEVAAALLALGQGISSLLISLTPLIGPLVQIAAIIVDRWAAGLQLLATFLTPVISALADVLAPILPQIATLLGQVSDAIKPLVAQFGTELAGALKDAQTFLAPLMDALREVGSEILAHLQEVLPQITPSLGELARAFADVAKEIFKLLPDFVRFAGDLLVQLIDQLPVLVPMLKDLALAFLDMFTQLAPLIPDLLKLLTEFLKPIIPELPKLLPPLIDLVRVFDDLFQKLEPLLKKFLESPAALAAVKFLASNAILALGALRDGLNFVIGAVQMFLGTFFGFPDQVAAGLGRMAGAIKGWINDIIGWFERVINGIADAVPGGIIPHVSIPRLARGAIVNRPTLGVFGEAGPEAVIPLSDPRRARELADASGLTGMLLPSAVGLPGGPMVVNLNFYLDGQPLYASSEVQRFLIDALNAAKNSGFNLGAVGAS